MPTDTLRNVPANEVGEVVQSYIDDDDATNVVATKNADGTFDVTATFP